MTLLYSVRTYDIIFAGIAMEYLNSLDIQEDAEKEVNNLKDLAFKNPPKVCFCLRISL